MTSVASRHPSRNLLTLPTNRVHVWYAALDVEPDELDGLEKTLARDERVRASRFHFRKDRHHFTAARGILRQILARYVDREPGELRLGYGRYGKPFLQQDCGTSELRFNLAHSHGMALYGIALNREIGVDLERIDRSFADRQVAECFFSPREALALRTLPASLQIDAFFYCWTRKEAYVKAHGTGILTRLDSFDVSLIPGDPPELLNGGHDSWSIHAPKLMPGYAAAVVVQGSCDLKAWKWKSTWRKCASVSQNLTVAASVAQRCYSNVVVCD